MSDAALESQGMQLLIGDGASPEVFSVIEEVSNLSGPGGSAAIIDTTDLLSTGKEKRMGLPDEGQLSFTLFYIPSNAEHILLREQRAARERTTFRLIFTDNSPSTTWTFSGFVTTFTVSASVDGVVTAQVTIEITGSITES